MTTEHSGEIVPRPDCVGCGGLGYVDTSRGPVECGCIDNAEHPSTLVNEQAEDDGLWFVATTAPEAYLQQELRRLHAAVESYFGRIIPSDSDTDKET